MRSQEIGLIRLTNGGFVIVDWDLFPKLNQHRWQRMTLGGAYRSVHKNGKVTTVSLHRVVNQTPPGADTDHRNRLRWDNTRENLRDANKSLNAGNCTPAKRKPGSKSGSKFKGVYFRHKKWCARIGTRKTLKYLGSFTREIDAARAYNKAALARYGEFALLNQID